MTTEMILEGARAILSPFLLVIHKIICKPKLQKNDAIGNRHAALLSVH